MKEYVMTMPIDLVLVRHGESEGNIAERLSRKGDDTVFTPDFRQRHSSQWRLTKTGIRQARIVGKWLKKEFAGPPHFDRYYASEYIRAMETAAHLDLPRAKWYAEHYLRERDWGKLECIPHRERKEQFAHDLARKDSDPYFWRPPQGEMLVDLCLRIDRVIDTLHRECRDQRVLIVCHGEVMWAFRIRLERLSQERFRELTQDARPEQQIHNGQVLHYSRRDPKSGELSATLNWMRSVCPEHPEWSDKKEWQSIVRPTYSNSALLTRAQNTPRQIG